MENVEKMEQLLRDYGYPKEAIPSLLREIGDLNYEKVEKLIIPYHDITANKS